MQQILIRPRLTYHRSLEQKEHLAELQHQERIRRLAELKEKHLAYWDRSKSSSSYSSNYDTKNIDQVTNTL